MLTGGKSTQYATALKELNVNNHRRQPVVAMTTRTTALKELSVDVNENVNHQRKQQLHST
ncbi:MAG TPA: hypothetical protein VHO46_00075 [Bacteroidales bacterium]|nr:hypothetical protein [Bacteroidales bacterium]